jgi:hypothetical protein
MAIDGGETSALLVMYPAGKSTDEKAGRDRNGSVANRARLSGTEV